MINSLTPEERNEVMKMLVLQARTTSQSISDLLRRLPEQSEQLKTARTKEAGIMKLMEMVVHNRRAQ